LREKISAIKFFAACCHGPPSFQYLFQQKWASVSSWIFTPENIGWINEAWHFLLCFRRSNDGEIFHHYPLSQYRCCSSIHGLLLRLFLGSFLECDQRHKRRYLLAQIIGTFPHHLLRQNVISKSE